MKKNYSVDESEGVIRYSPDSDLPIEETIPISEIVEMALWFRRRQGVLRLMLQERDMLSTRQPMQRIGDYYIGCTKELQKVKVLASVWDKMMADTERIIRVNWLHDIQEKRDGTSGARMVIVDEQGKEVGLRDIHGNPIAEVEYTEADCPREIIDPELYKRRQPEWWAVRPENIDLGKFAKLP